MDNMIPLRGGIDGVAGEMREVAEHQSIPEFQRKPSPIDP